VRVVGVDAAGAVHDYVRDAAAPAGEKASPLGGSVELARGHAPGPLRLVALFSRDAIEEKATQDAIGRLTAKQGAPPPEGVVTGLVVIEP
jgi:hypothetical protein